MTKRLLTLAPVLALLACGGHSLTLVDDGNGTGPGGTATVADFVGTWTCDAASSTTAQSGSSSDTLLVTFAANPDDSLTMTFRMTKEGATPVDGGVDPTCPYTFTIANRTATATHGQTVTVGDATFSFVSGTMEVNGNLTLTEAVAPVPGADVATATDTVTATCTKDPP